MILNSAKFWLTGAGCALSLLSASAAVSAAEVVVYSARIEEYIKPLFDKYTEKTGVTVKFTTANEAALLERLVAEGKDTPADMLLTVDVGNLWLAEEKGILAKVDSAKLKQNIPEHLRDPEGHWFGLSVRARPIMYSTERVKPSDLSTYEALADAKWKGMLCLRTSKKVYNQSLTAMMMKHLGAEETEKVIKGWVANLATDVFSSDTKLLEAIKAGQCDVGISNTYYLGRLQEKDPSYPVAIFWPNQQTTGTHVNISGAGITQHAKNPTEAIALLEWLSSPEAQGKFAELNHEYPANPSVPASDLVRKWGDFKPDMLNVAEAGRGQVEATKLMDRAGYK